MFDAIRFLTTAPANSDQYVAHHDAALVVLSVGVAVAAAYAAMVATARCAASIRRGTRLGWLSAAALTLGLGTWAMHFIGMLALNLPCGISYDVWGTMVSMLPGVVGSALALSLVVRPAVSQPKLWFSSVLLGGGIGAMHYSGMAAMQIEGFVAYAPDTFVLSVGIAVALAYLGLRVWVQTRCANYRCTAVVALIMGAAVSGMHYTAMGASYFLRQPGPAALRSVMEPGNLAVVVAVVAGLLVLLIVVLAALSRYQTIADQLRESEQRWRFALEGGGDGVWDVQLPSGEGVLSPAGKTLFGFAPDENPHHVSQWQERVHPEDRQRVMDEYLAFLRSAGTYYASEYRVLTHDQKMNWVMSQGMVARRDGRGKVVRLIGTVRNVTERKLAQQRDQRHSLVYGLLAGKAPMAQVLQYIVDGLEAANPAHRCAIYLLEDGKPRAQVAAVLGLVGPDGMPLMLDMPAPEGCGLAAQSGLAMHAGNEPGSDARGVLAPWLRALGVQVCWSQPIVSSAGVVLGALDVYSSSPAAASDPEAQWLADEARLVALVVERSRAESRLQLAASVFTHAREGIMITDAQGSIIEVNDTFSRITGYPRDEVLGRNPRLLQSGRQGPDFYAQLWKQVKQNGQWTGEIWNRRKNGEVFAEMCTISVVQDARGQTQNYLALFSDITPLKAHQQELERLAHYDNLTGLPNRTLLADRLRQAMAHCSRSNKSLAVVYLDLDGFKEVNDQHGHNVGDELLVVVAGRMSAVLREGDTLARMGGDEFVAVLLDLDAAADCETVLERLLQAASQPVDVGELRVQVSASIGVTLYPQDGADADQLMRHADQAMYQAKHRGKNCFHLFDVDQDAALHAHHEIMERVRQGFRRREFVLHYQPKVNLRDARVQGLEALIRWQHPERGLLPPSEFLPAIQHTDVMIELGQHVVESALSQLHQWRAVGLGWPVAVNIAAQHLTMKDFVPWLKATLERYPEVPASLLELEIVETAALDDVRQVAAVIDACHALGVTFAIDDFGTGYSSLSYLKSLPADRIKIDRSFVRDMLDDSSDLAVVRGVISLANVFHREVVAEGLDRPEQGVLLMQMGCDVAQGYGIARPMPGDEVPAWVARYVPDRLWARWARQLWDMDDLPLLLAGHDHARAVTALLHGTASELEATTARAMAQATCRLSQWLEGRAATVYAHMPSYAVLVQRHADLHRLMEGARKDRSVQPESGLALRAALQALTDQIAVFQDQCAAVDTVY